MKVFFDGMIFGHQKVGGISTMWREYFKRFPGQIPEMKLLSPHAPENAAYLEALNHKNNVQLVRDFFYWPVRIFWKPSVRSFFLQFYLDSQVDIFHSTYYSTISNPRIKKVITVLDMIYEMFPQSMPPRWFRFNSEMKSKTIHQADAIVAISHQTKADILRFYPDIPAQKIHVIYLGGPAQAGGFQLAQLTGLFDRLGLDLAPFSYYLFVGKRTGYKNFEILVDLMKRGQLARQKILCVGDARDHFPDLVQSAGLADQLVFLTRIGDEDLRILYHYAAALIYPSKYEGFGLPLLEAMACQCPVISSNLSCLPEVGGDAALYFDPDSVESLEDALARLEASGREPWIEKGLKNLGRFSWDESAASLIQVYRDLLSLPACSGH